jgi:type I site-specific restriction-modification system R (restriction) subunit
MTDRDDLDSQIFRTFVGCGVADEKSPRASSGKELESLLKENHRIDNVSPPGKMSSRYFQILQ